MNQPLQTILTSRVIGIIRMKEYTRAAETARALAAGGIRALEYTLSGSGALAAISEARAAVEPGIAVGAGTVLSVQDVEEARAAGAEFIVTPVLDVEVIKACNRLGLPIACGALSPTELYSAARAGADLIKLFPARLGGVQYMRDVLAPLPWLKLVPTGGVSAENARSYLEAGAVAVAIGGNLVPEKLVREGNFDEITARARQCAEAAAES
jgi:2-dehydro-3-deoxyphosphogluconate aldolase/(4S)-4-hydroxy-2-oxoglutarate aldolase